MFLFCWSPKYALSTPTKIPVQIIISSYILVCLGLVEIVPRRKTFLVIRIREY